MTDKLSTTEPIDRTQLPTDQFGWGFTKWLVTPDQPGGAGMSFGEVIALPGMGHDRHNHPDAEEILYFLSGTGLQMVDDEEPFEVHAGDVVYIPKAIFHSTLNTGWEPLKILAIYNPGGSERALRELPDYRLVPPGGAPKFG
ncbi:MAG TPA: cupin domain-containing protein [Thermomicrobiales bacterium]|nr:cupin domain-containing protein [Thermomicrobiales bacterium]